MRQVRGSRAVRVVLIGSALALVAGCAGGSSGQASTLPPLSTSSVTVSPSGTTSPAAWVPPSLPVPTPSPEVTERTVHGAEAAAASYFAALDYAFATGDTSPIKAMSTPECVSCKGQIEEIERVYADGGHYSKRKTTVNASISTTASGEEALTVLVAYIATPMVHFGKGASPARTFSSDKESDMQFELTFVEGRWLVAGYRLLKG